MKLGVTVMWDRTILKGNARQALSGGRYWTAYAVCIISSLISSIFVIIDRFFETTPFNIQIIMDPYKYYLYLESQKDKTSWTGFPSFLLFVFVALPLSVGIARFFVRNRFGETKLETLFSSFRGSYASTVGGMFTTILFNFLWFFVFIIPGFVKAMEYSMVRFILSDNPSIPGSRAREISRMMTNGEKGAIFVLYLSFLGWYLLAVIAAAAVGWLFWPVSGIASVATSSFVTAYEEAAFAELYIFLRDRALQCGMVQPAELGLVPPAV